MLEILKLKKKKLISYSKFGKLETFSDSYAHGIRVFRFFQPNGSAAALLLSMGNSDKINNIAIVEAGNCDDALFIAAAKVKYDFTHEDMSYQDCLNIIEINDNDEICLFGHNLSTALKQGGTIKRSPFSYRKYLVFHDIGQESMTTLVDPSGAVYIVGNETVERWYTKEISEGYARQMLMMCVNSMLYKRV